MFEFLYVLTIYGKFGGWVGPEGPLTVFFSIGSCIFFLRPPCQSRADCRSCKCISFWSELLDHGGKFLDFLGGNSR